MTPELIVALDVDTLEKAKHFVGILYPTVKLFKVGSQLFTASGPEAVKMVVKERGKVFLDLKFYDIPQTVYSSSSSVSAISAHCNEPLSETVGIEEPIKKGIQAGIFMMTVHTIGGKKMLIAAVRGATEKAAKEKIPKPFIVGVTRLTSDENSESTQREVLEAAKLAKDSGLDGIVCSVHEAEMIRKEFGEKFLIVTPGIRPKGYKRDDQARTATAQEAIQAGANYIVVGRPILEAEDPLKAVEELV